MLMPRTPVAPSSFRAYVTFDGDTDRVRDLQEFLLREYGAQIVATRYTEFAAGAWAQLVAPLSGFTSREAADEAIARAITRTGFRGTSWVTTEDEQRDADRVAREEEWERLNPFAGQFD